MRAGVLYESSQLFNAKESTFLAPFFRAILLLSGFRGERFRPILCTPTIQENDQEILDVDETTLDEWLELIRKPPAGRIFVRNTFFSLIK